MAEDVVPLRPLAGLRSASDPLTLPRSGNGPGPIAPSAAEVAVLAVALLAAVSPEEVLTVVADRAEPLFGASLVAIALVDADGDRLRLVRARNVPGGIHERYPLPIDARTLPGDALLRGEPVFLGSRGERERAYPDLARLEVPQEASATLPLPGATGFLGALTFGYDAPRVFTGGEVARLREVARMTGLALQRAAALDAEREARLAAETTSRRLQTLQRVIGALARATEPRQVVDAVLVAASESLEASAATVAEYDPASGTAVNLAVEGLPPELSLIGVHFPVTVARMAVDLVVSGRPITITSLADRDARYPDMTGNGVRQQSWANLPLIVAGAVVGWVSFGWDDPREFDDDELGFLMTLAAHTAAATERARLLTQARTTAEVLQKSLLPEVTGVPGWERAGHYLPAATGVEVGGDWFDAFPLPDGQVGIVIADVAGKGPRAAAVMGAARGALRAFAVVEPTPEEVLCRLDTYLARYKPDEIITCLYGVLDPAPGRFRYANAGHPPPLVVGRGGDVRWLDEVLDPPLGTLPVIARRSTCTDLVEPVLVLYSDGLVERRQSDLQEGLDELAEAAARLLPGAEDLGAAVGELCSTVAPDHSNVDDRAVIAFRRLDTTG